MSLTDLQRDILIKSAEGIQEGMWCRGDAFKIGNDEGFTSARVLLYGTLTVEAASKAERCATGELAFRTVLADAEVHDFQEIVDVVGVVVVRECGDAIHDDRITLEDQITQHNDYCMKDLDPFTAGQEWARIFREVAEA